jgi:hypothetical protein
MSRENREERHAAGKPSGPTTAALYAEQWSTERAARGVVVAQADPARLGQCPRRFDGAAPKSAGSITVIRRPQVHSHRDLGAKLGLRPGADPRHDASMKKNRQKTGDRSLSLRARDLASVRGGQDGVLHDQAIGGGVSPHDDGVISARSFKKQY